MSAIGYARVSTLDQDTALQIDALTAAGCDRIFEDHASGARTDRPQLAAALDYLRPGDTFTVWKLDRLGRSLPHLIEIVTGLRDDGVQFRSLTEGMDTTSAVGELVFNIFGSFAQFERALIRERTLAGLAAARARGRVGGRPPTMTGHKLAAARALLADGQSVASAAAAVGVSRRTLYRHLPDVSSVGGGGAGRLLGL